MAAFIAPTPLTRSAPRYSVLTSTPLHGLRPAYHTTPTTRVHLLPKMRLEVGAEEDNPIDPINPVDPIGDAPIPEDTKLFVGNLSWNTTDSSLGEAFSRYGTVVDAKVVTDRFTGKSRGFGFIEYDAAESAAEALEGMDGVEVDGRTVRVDRANRRPPRPRRPSSNYY